MATDINKVEAINISPQQHGLRGERGVWPGWLGAPPPPRPQCRAPGPGRRRGVPARADRGPAAGQLRRTPRLRAAAAAAAAHLEPQLPPAHFPAPGHGYNR